jgi:hypothetical protein
MGYGVLPDPSAEMLCLFMFMRRHYPERKISMAHRIGAVATTSRKGRPSTAPCPDHRHQTYRRRGAVNTLAGKVS